MLACLPASSAILPHPGLVSSKIKSNQVDSNHIRCELTCSTLASSVCGHACVLSFFVVRACAPAMSLGASTGLDCEAVLALIVGTQRPITLLFERTGVGGMSDVTRDAPLVPHS
jgi:hypothetical protein